MFYLQSVSIFWERRLFCSEDGGGTLHRRGTYLPIYTTSHPVFISAIFRVFYTGCSSETQLSIYSYLPITYFSCLLFQLHHLHIVTSQYQIPFTVYSVYIKSGNTLNYLLHQNYKLYRYHIHVILKRNSESLFTGVHGTLDALISSDSSWMSLLHAPHPLHSHREVHSSFLGTSNL
jgi:hypothetical protein